MYATSTYYSNPALKIMGNVRKPPYSQCLSDTFSLVTKLKARKVMEDPHWACLATLIDIAYMLGKDDLAVSHTNNFLIVKLLIYS